MRRDAGKYSFLEFHLKEICGRITHNELLTTISYLLNWKKY